MTLDNVRRLFESLGGNPALRDSLNAADGPEGRDAVLRGAGLFFTDAEFDEMSGVLHARCQTGEEAERFLDFRDWWNFLRRT